METSTSSSTVVNASSPSNAGYSSPRQAGVQAQAQARVVGIGRRPVDYTGNDGWVSRIVYKTLYGAAAGVGTGVVIGTYKSSNVFKWAGTMGTNCALVTLCFCGSQELIREIRASDPDDLVNSLLGGLASGGVLGRIQGGPSRAVPFALLFAGVGTGLQYGANSLSAYRSNQSVGLPKIELEPDLAIKSIKPEVNKEPWQFPEWFPIQKLDVEAAAKRKAEKEREFKSRVDSLHKGQGS